ncbi:MAG: hypothetical protein CEE40_12820 [Chloroflexi bacterium B3_Chlor]|nr:MAG: hypothetical protein CEE40_12820 [Chloroflexi bacterium B3_Chlor]
MFGGSVHMEKTARGKMETQRPGNKQRSGLRLNAWWLVIGLVALAVVLLVSACGAPQAELEPTATQAVAPPAATSTPPQLSLPSWVLNGSQKVQSSYVAGTLHAEELAYIPCYCSCGAFGHTAVIDCFIAGTDATGAPVYDNHAYY